MQSISFDIYFKDLTDEKQAEFLDLIKDLVFDDMEKELLFIEPLSRITFDVEDKSDGESTEAGFDIFMSSHGRGWRNCGHLGD